MYTAAPAKIEKRPLPKLDDLYGNLELAGKHNELNRLLNCDPKPEWVREHPFAKNVRYIPISIIEYLLTSVFIKWRVEIKSAVMHANSEVVTVRLWVLDPVTMEWDWQEGIGAAPIQTEKGAAATDFTKVLTDAVMKGAPAAESYAIKDAAEKLGKLFGKDLNRRDFMPYTNLEGKLDPSKVQASKEMYEELRELFFNSTYIYNQDEYQIIDDKLRGFISVEEYAAMKKDFTDKQETELDRLRNGRTSSQKTINKAVQQAVSMPNT